MALSDYDPIIAQAAEEYPGVDPDLIRAQLAVESGGNPQAKNKATGATGVAQLMPATAASLGVDPTDPKQAIPAMFKIMAQNLKAQGGDTRKALMEYYGGPNTKIWGPNTQKYPDLVMAHYAPKGAQVAQATGVADEWPSDLPAAGSASAAGNDNWPGDLPTVEHGQPVPADAPELRSAPILPTWERIPAVISGELAHGALTTAGIPGDILSRVGLPGYLPTSSNLLEAGGRLGLTGQTTQLPQTEGEKFAGSAAEGLGSAAVIAPIVAATGPEALPGLFASGAAGGAGSELASEAFPNNPAAPVVGGILGGLAGGETANLLAKTTSKLAGVATPEAKAFSTLDMTPRSPAYTAPLGATKLVPSDEIKTATENELGGKLEQTAASLGDSRTLQQAGEKLQDGAQRWLSNTLRQKLNQTWAPVDAAVGTDLEVPLTNFTKQVSETAARGGSLRTIAQHYRSENFSKLASDVDMFEGLGNNPTWQEVANLRSDLGEAIGNPSIAESIGGKQLRAQYAALTADMRAALPKEVVPQFDAANAESTRLYGIAKNVMGKVVKSPHGDPGLPAGNVASNLLTGGKKDAQVLATLGQELPDETKELAAVNLRRIASTDPETPGSGLAPRFDQLWTNMPPETKAALYPDFGTRARIDAAARIAQRAKAVGSQKGGAFRPLEAATSSFATGELLSHMAELGARAAGAQTSGEIFGPGSAGYIAGAVIPPTVRAARNVLANSILAARYAGVPGATFAPYARPWAVGSTIGAENLLYPYPTAEDKQQ